MSARVCVIDEQIVRPKGPVVATSEALPLGPLDHLVHPAIPISLVFLYETQSGEKILSVQRLKAALAELLNYHPCLAGSLLIDASGHRSVVQLRRGCLFVEASCDDQLVTFKSLSGFNVLDLPGGGTSLLPSFRPTVDSVLQGPVLKIQHTRFGCGSVTLGVTLLHAVYDASGYFQIMRDLSAVYRGQLIESSKAPYLAELMISMPDTTRTAALNFKPPLHKLVECEAVPEYVQDVDATSSHVEGRLLRFTKDQLHKLKRDATSPEGGWVSTFDALAALIWQRVYQARAAIGTSKAILSRDFLTSVDYRARLGVDQRVPFNCLMTPFTSASHEYLMERPISEVASSVHNLTRFQVSAAEAEGTAMWIAAQPDTRRITWGFNGGPGCTMVSAWNKFDMGIVFEVSPSYVAPPFTLTSTVDGLGYVLPSPRDHVGGLDFYLALDAPLWGSLANDDYLLQYCTILGSQGSVTRV
eukprot:Blabericola_migrator_1__1549@NODE_140_length_13109_cov_183_610106_g122_i0_p2_GENE_NODE_140_length_13109_cov_183_610106_g122_i0NODE_140_length_13109_cov_183_610106_g122_i0_p2_ORF_typecomplete_len471_score53_66Transferase/PF02458_15/6_2e62Condensation/PF00668_20/7_9e06CHAT/PF12770_7/7e02CHAT/PF12770_7/0_41_NODE_140_length_13109_cov_183_610106_g122_i025513963